MKGFIFAAGFGERLRPITDKIPKPLVKVCGIPSICYSLSLLREAGVSDVVINLHYRHEEIAGFFRERKNFGMNILFSIEEEILGTGGGLKRCEQYLRDDDFIIVNSDIVSDIKLSPVIDLYNSSSSEGVLCLSRAGGRGRKARVAVSDGRIADIKNILKTGLEMEYDYMGIAVLSPLIFKFLDKGFSSVADTGFCDLIRNFRLGYHDFSGIWLDIGTVQSLDHAGKYLKKHGAGLIERVCESTGVLPSED